MICPNLKNPQVAQEFNELVSAVGERAAYDIWNQNNGNGIDLAPNGAKSKLFSDLLSYFNNDRPSAIQTKAKVFSNEFKTWFGDWTKSNPSTNAYANTSIAELRENVNLVFQKNSELSKIGSQEDYINYLHSVFPNTKDNSIYWHGSNSNFRQGFISAKKSIGSGAPEVGDEFYLAKQPWSVLQYVNGINRKFGPDKNGFNHWNKLWWELKEIMSNGRRETNDWKDMVIDKNNVRQAIPNKKGVFNRDSGGVNGKWLSERKTDYGYENKTDVEFFRDVFGIEYGKDTFNSWVNRNKTGFKELLNKSEGIYPAIINTKNPIKESNQNTYYEEERGLKTLASKNNNDAILSKSADNEFGSDVAVVFNPKDNVYFLGTNEDQNAFKNFINNKTTNISKVVDESSKESENFEVIDLSPNYDDGGESSIFTIKYKKDIKKDIPLKDRDTKVSQMYNYLKKLRNDDIKKVNDLTEDKVELTKDGNLHVKGTGTTIYIKRLGLNSLSEYKEYEINKITSERSDDTLLKQAESSVPQYEESNQFIDVTIDTSTGQMSGNIGSVAIELPEQLRGRGLGKELYLLLNKYLYNTKQITLKSDPLGTSEKAHHVWESFRKAGKATLISGNPNDFENGFYTAKYELNPPQQVTTSISKVVDDNGEPLIVYHGSDYIFTQFSLDTKNRANMTDLIKKGIYFSNERAIADSYAHSREERTNNSVYKLIEEINALRGIITDPYFEDAYGEFEGFDTYEKHMSKDFELAEDENALWFTSLYKSNVEKQLPNAAEILKQLKLKNYDKAISLAKENIRPTYNTVYPVFLNFRNPIQINTDYSTISTAFSKHDKNQLNSAESIIVKNVDDGIHEYTLRISNTYIAFNPNQIKSAIANDGGFAENDANIFHKNTEKLNKLNIQAAETYKSTDKFETAFKGNETSNSTEVLTNLLNDGSIPKRYSSLVSNLMNTPVSINLVDALSLNDYMRLNAKTKSIGVTTRALIDKTSKTEFAEALIHELVHYHTVDAYETNSKFKKLVDKYFAKARKYFKEQADLLDAGKDYDISTFYGLTDQYEFISEIMSNPKFREALARKDTPLWKQFLIGIVNRIFNTDIKVYNNDAKIVSSIMDATNNIIISNGANFIMADREVEEDFNKKVSFKDSFEGYYDNVREDKAILQQASMTIKTMHEGLTSNIKSLSREKHGGTKKEELERLKQHLSELEDKQAMIEFLYTIDDKLQQPYAFVSGKYRDLRDTDVMSDSDKYETLMNSMPDHRLMQLQHDVVGFYGPMINRINELFLAGYFNDLYEEQNRTHVLDEKVLKFEQAITRTVGSYAKLDAQFKSLVRAKAQYNLKKLGLEYGSPTIDSYVGDKLLSMVGDISAIERSILSPKASSDEAARLLHRSLVDANTRVSWAFDSKGKQLMALQSKARNPQELYEVDENGKRTGYLIRPRNYGMFKRDYKTFINELNDKYGIVDNNLLSLPHEELIKYRKEKNDWLSEHAERRYTKEYYNLYNNLSANTEMKLKDVQNKIASVLSSVMSDDRKPELERLSDKDWFILRDLWREKKSLASQFYLDGTMKSGDDLDSAIELSDVNKMLNKNLKYKANIDKFNEALAKKEQQYKDNPELLRKWKERNTKLEYDQEFWDKLSQIESADRGEYYKKLNEAKSSIISVYRESNFQPEIEDNSIRNTIRSLDKEMARVRGSIKVKKAAGSIAFSHIAEIEKTDRYYLDKQEALKADKLAPGMYKIWQDNNHYTDERGVLTPYSYYTYIKPKDEKYIKVMPSAAFQEIDSSSPFFNDNYDNNIDDKVQPKKSLYDNSTAYEKAMSHGGNANLYNGLLETMQQSQGKIPFLNNRDAYFLPQVTGTMYRHVASNGLKGVGQYVADKIAVKNDDVEYAIDEVLMRADKSKLRFIPTHYVTPLAKPENISSDITGITADFFRMAANYDEMSKLAPTFEVVLSAIGNRSVRMRNLMSRKEYEVSGKETNLYKQIEEMMSANLYGELTKELGVVQSRQNKPGEIKVSISKVLGGFGKWSSITMLGWNTTSLLAGLGTAKVQTAAEMLSNRFFGSTDYAKADFEVTKNLPGMISNFGANKTTNKMLCLLEHFGVVFSDEEKFAYTNRSRVQRIGKSIIDPMMPWTVVDMTIKTPVMTAVLFNHKLVTTIDENGNEVKEFMPRRKFIRQYIETPLKEGEQKHTRKEAKRLWNMMSETLYDAYTIDKDGIVGIKDKYQEYVTPNLEYSVRNTIMSLTAKLDGVLNQTDKTALQRQAFVKLIFMFRGFLVSNLEDRLLKKKQWNYMIEDWDEAQYRAALKGIWSYLKYSYTSAKNKFKNAENNKINVPYHEREALRKTMSEAGITLAIYVAAMMIKPLADKDKRNYWMNLLLYLCDRVGLEMRAAYTGVDLLNMLKSVSAVNTMVDNLIVVGSALFPDIDLSNASKHKQKLVTKGAYKGMSQWEKSAIKLTPFKNIIEAPYVRDKDKYLRGQLSKQN